jgi:hypothetical protein
MPASVARWQHGSRNVSRLLFSEKSHKIANNSPPPEAREKNKHRFGTLGIFDIFGCTLDKILKNQILLSKINFIFLVTTKL